MTFHLERRRAHPHQSWSILGKERQGLTLETRNKRSPPHACANNGMSPASNVAAPNLRKVR